MPPPPPVHMKKVKRKKSTRSRVEFRQFQRADDNDAGPRVSYGKIFFISGPPPVVAIFLLEFYLFFFSLLSVFFVLAVGEPRGPRPSRPVVRTGSCRQHKQYRPPGFVRKVLQFFYRKFRKRYNRITLSWFARVFKPPSPVVRRSDIRIPGERS